MKRLRRDSRHRNARKGQTVAEQAPLEELEPVEDPEEAKLYLMGLELVDDIEDYLLWLAELSQD
jgi:hypothetical protein